MNSMVKEVKERNGASAPVAPTLPSLQSGFPSVQHRSQRISQFKRARGGGPTGHNGSYHVSEPPKVREAGPSPVPSVSPAEASGTGVHKTTPNDGEFEPDFQAANDAQVAQMTSSQREREIEELESTISPELLALLRARVAKKVANADNAVASTSSVKVEADSALKGLAQGARKAILEEEFSSEDRISSRDENTMRDKIVATKSGAFGNFISPRYP